MYQKNKRSMVTSHIKLGMQVKQQPATAFQLWMQAIKNLKNDVFPFLTMNSISLALLILDILAYLFFQPAFITIKPYKGISDLMPWILSPFATKASKQIGLVSLVLHLIFLANVCAEIQSKMLNRVKFITLYVLTIEVSNIFSIFLQSTAAVTCGNTNSYSLYLYLLLLNPKLGFLHTKQSNTCQNYEVSSFRAFSNISYSYSYPGYVDSQFSIQRNDNLQSFGQETNENDEKAIGFYKFIILSYFVYLGNYQSFCSYISYLTSLILIFFVAYLRLY